MKRTKTLQVEYLDLEYVQIPRLNVRRIIERTANPIGDGSHAFLPKRLLGEMVWVIDAESTAFTKKEEREPEPGGKIGHLKIEYISLGKIIVREILQREVKPIGNGGCYVLLPKAWLGKSVWIIEPDKIELNEGQPKPEDKD